MPPRHLMLLPPL